MRKLAVGEPSRQWFFALDRFVNVAVRNTRRWQMPRKPFYDQGPYIGHVLSQALTEAKTGTAQFLLRVKIIGEPDGEGGVTEFAGNQQYERSIYLPLTEKTLEPGKGWVLDALSALNFEGDSLAELDPSHPRCHSFVGQDIPLYCSHRDSQDGGTQENWSVSRQREVITAAVDPKKIKKLDALFGKAKRASGASAVKAQPIRSAGSQSDNNDYADQEITDEDIPF